MIKLLLSVGVLALRLGPAAATPCHELQQAQLMSLNERMTQMIDTISSLLPKKLKKPPPAASAAPDYAYDPAYYTPASPPPPQIMYVSAPAAPPAQIPLSAAPGFQAEYPFANLAPLAPLPSRPYYQYDQQLTQYANPIPVSYFAPPSYPPAPYSLAAYGVQSPYPPEYAYPPPAERLPAYPRGPALPGAPQYPSPMFAAPPAYAPGYPSFSELLLPKYM